LGKIIIRIDEIEIYPFYFACRLGTTDCSGKKHKVSEKFMKRYEKIMIKFKKLQEELEKIYENI